MFAFIYFRQILLYIHYFDAYFCAHILRLYTNEEDIAYANVCNK